MVRSPASCGRSPRLLMNAETLALACSSSPAMNTSSGPPAARTSRKMVLNAFTTRALAGAASATICAMDVSSGMARPVAPGLKGLVLSTMILPSSAPPYSLTTGTALSNSTARMTMSPPGAAPHVPAVAPSPSLSTRAAALAASRPTISTALPPSRARAPMAPAMFPEPMMLTSLMMCSPSRLLGTPIWVLNLTNGALERKLCTPIGTNRQSDVVHRDARLAHLALDDVGDGGPLHHGAARCGGLGEDALGIATERAVEQLDDLQDRDARRLAGERVAALHAALGAQDAAAA